MISEAYTDRMISKLNTVNKLYAERMYRPVGVLGDLTAMQTKEHLRTPPVCTQTLHAGDSWGSEYGNLWIHATYTVPEELRGQTLYLRPKTGAAEILYFIDGKPDGIFNSRGDYLGMFHSVQMITDNAVPGTTYELDLECYAGHFCIGCAPFDHYGEHDLPHEGDYVHTFEGLDICVCERDLYDFVFDFNTVLQMASDLPENNFMRHRARAVLAEIYPRLCLLPEEASEEALHRGVAESRALMAPLLEKSVAETTRGRIALLGHSHMDTAWLWPVSETIRKCARTYSNVVKLMKQYPEYKFIQSSALHLEWMRVYYPSIFEDIRKFVKEGRYEPNGGVWVECDCNITSGELMARQFMYGQHFTRKYMDYTSNAFWLPDTFGYNAAIPQIMQEADVDYFCTTKLFWNDMNRFPYSTFRWEGIDGTQVLTHLHNLQLFPDVKTMEQQVDVILNKQIFEEKLFAFGYGDGGGGPTPAMLESARRLTNVPGLPKVEYQTAGAFMQGAEKVRDQLPLYVGELYLEGHRGTLSSMHEIKRTNRKAEFALRNMDYFNVVSGQGKGDRTDELYKVLLTNQFHDILPGTCMTGVNDLAVSQNREVIREADEIAAKGASSLTDGNADTLTVFNTLSFARGDVLALDDNGRFTADYPCQKYTDVTGRAVMCVGGVSVDALGSTTLRLCDTESKAPSAFRFDGKTLQTPLYTVCFDDGGFISSLFDKRQNREVRRAGGAPLNTVYAGQDVPTAWDNWDLEAETLLCQEPQTEMTDMHVVSDGAVCFVLRMTRKIGRHSTLTQDIIFYADDPRIDFHSLMDWNDKHCFVKAGFDVDVLSRTVRNEIQFGHVQRPTIRNTNEEQAKFEVCNHKWSDLGDTRFGVAILNDCKYGISVEGSDMRLTLHRGGTHPDATGDPGLHEFTYSLLPHGAFSTESVIVPAYELNVPVVAVAGTVKTASVGTYVPSCDHVILEALKPAALRHDACVARYYECEGTSGVCTVTVPEGCRAYDVNILEDIRTEIPVTDGKITLSFSPFKIRSVMFVAQ